MTVWTACEVISPIVIVMLRVANAASVTIIVAVVADAAVVGVPDMIPAALIDSPAGNVVELNVYGVVPPLAPDETLIDVIAVPTVDAGMSNDA